MTESKIRGGAAPRPRTHPGHCPQCRHQFRSHRPEAVYCSDTCRSKAWRRRHDKSRNDPAHLTREVLDNEERYKLAAVNHASPEAARQLLLLYQQVGLARFLTALEIAYSTATGKGEQPFTDRQRPRPRNLQNW